MTTVQNFRINMNQINNLPIRDTNLLHLKPLSHQLCRGISYIGTTLQQKAVSNHWRGKVQIGFAKGFVACGYGFNIVIATVEAVVSLVFATLALSFHALSKGRFTLFQKLTLKLCAYNINTILIIGLQILCLKKWLFSRYRTINVIGNHAIHGASAVISQFIGLGFDHWAGRKPASIEEPPQAYLRIVRILVEKSPVIIRETTTAAVHDFSVHIRNNLENPHLQAFFQATPGYSQTLSRFTFQRLRENRAYRTELLQLFANYFVLNGVLNNEVIQNDVGQNIQVYGANNENDKNYQKFLKDSIKKTFIELHDTPELVKLLSKEQDEKEAIEDGRVELTTFSATIQLASYAQLQEIENEIACPEAFGIKELQEYNHRRKKILEAKAILVLLNPDEKRILIQKILKTGDFNIKDQPGLGEERAALIQKLFLLIGSLAGELHQGHLLSQKYVNVNLMNAGDVNNAFGAVNLFQGACQEAEKEIANRKPPVTPA